MRDKDILSLNILMLQRAKEWSFNAPIKPVNTTIKINDNNINGEISNGNSDNNER